MAYRRRRQGYFAPQRASNQAPLTYGLKVNHLPCGIHRVELERPFRQFGTISSVHVRDGGLESYAHINYYSHTDAVKAAAEMHGKKLFGNRVTVRVQGEGDTLTQGYFAPQRAPLTYGLKVNHLPQGIHRVELERAFCQFGTISSVHVRDGGLESYAHINYYSHTDAVKAAAEMHGKELFGNRVTVRVQGERDTLPEGAVCAVKVTNLPKAVTEEELSGLFNFHGEGKAVSIKLNHCGGPFNYAYANYSCHEDAKKAELQLNGRRIYGSDIKAKFHVSVPNSPAYAVMTNQHVPTGISPMSQYPALMTNQHGIMPMSRYPRHTVAHDAHPSPPGCYLPSMPGCASAATLPSPTWHVPSTARMVSQPPRAAFPGMANSSTVKVSILGDLSPDDLHDVFSQCGTITQQPNIQEGNPNFAYVNFSSPKEASTACMMLNNTQVRGVWMKVRLDGKRFASRQECKPVVCDPLLARLLTSKCKGEVEALIQPMQAVAKRMKNGNGINLWGDPANLESAHQCVSLLVDKFTRKISHLSFSLHCLYLPLLARQEIATMIDEVEGKHGVEFVVMNSALQPLGEVTLGSFASSVALVFRTDHTSTKVRKVTDPPQLLVLPKNPTTEYTWEWEDDGGQGNYTPYPPDINAKLTQQYAAAAKGSLTLNISTREGTAEYLINFSAMTQMNTQTHTTRRIRRTVPSSPNWQYEDHHHQFQQYSTKVAAEIEQMYQTGRPKYVQINGRLYTFRFTAGNMKQINATTKRERQIKRQVCSHAAAAETIAIALEVRGLEADLQAARDELGQLLDKSAVSVTCELPATNDTALHASLLHSTRQCFVDATIVGSKVELTGVPGYVEKVKLMISEQALAHERNLLSSPIATFPEYWEQPQARKVELKSVGRGSKEWREIESCMLRTRPTTQILEITRIQNMWIWEMYSFSKQRMSKKNSGVVNERKLFHGTRDTPPDKIYNSEKGFDFRFASRGMWGEGTYFAVNANYPASGYAYSRPTGKQLILALVLTGETYRCPPQGTLKKPPAKPSGDGDYDSVSGHANGSDVFIIYDHEKAYPAYLITFH